MNQYPAWKYLLIVAVVVLGLLYALPNLYGEDRALQISALGGFEMSVAVRDDVENALRVEQIQSKSIELNEDRILVRFSDDAQQKKAAEHLATHLGSNYVVAPNLAPATPDWLANLGGKPMVMGLDLQGGVHFLMEVDMDTALKLARERYETDVRNLLRTNNIRYRSVQLSPQGLSVQLRNDQDRESASSVIFNQLPELTPQYFESAEIFGIRFTISEEKIAEITNTALQQNITTLRNRVNELGVAEPSVIQQGANRIVVELPGVQDTARAKRIIGATATLEYRAVCMGEDAFAAANSGLIPPGCRLYYQKDGNPVLLNKRLIVSGEQLIDAAAGFDPTSGTPQVSVTLNNTGGNRMRNFTLENVNNSMAVVYVERKSVTREVNGEFITEPEVIERVISIATIQEAFGRRFRTTGLDSPSEASELALLLRAGALAAPVEIVSESFIGPSLGKDNIEKGFNSVKIGFLLVLVFMAIYYRLFGLVADLALFANLVLVVALLSLLGATLTLPGIAGIVLTVGMAVDANVLIFERIREEIRNGNTPQASIRAGYDKAFSTIADANVTTLIAAIVLFTFGTGPIKGFAVTLSLGIITSMFTAIMGTRAVINLIYGRRARIKSLAI
ncbi:MAG: protein translocase subunit SecD [Lysobacterales bacterium]